MDSSTDLFILLEGSTKYLPLPCTMENAGAHRPGHANPGGAIRHVSMNHGEEAGATAMESGRHGGLHGARALFLSRFIYFA